MDKLLKNVLSCMRTKGLLDENGEVAADETEAVTE